MSLALIARCDSALAQLSKLFRSFTKMYQDEMLNMKNTIEIFDDSLQMGWQQEQHQG